MEVVEAQFSERAVQDELERIRTEHLEHGDYKQGARLCEALIQKYPESKWAGNAYLMAARCHHELGRTDEEAHTLEAFLNAFPQHVQAVTVRRALEDLQRRYEQQVHDGEHPVALRDVEGRLQRLYEGLHDLKQRQEHLEELSRSVSSLAGQVDDLKAKAQLLAADLEGESGEPTVLELVNALIQDLRMEVDTQRKRTDARLAAMSSTIEDLKLRFKGSTRVLWASVAAALVAFAMLIGAMYVLQPPALPRVPKKHAARRPAVRARIVPRPAPAAVAPLAGQARRRVMPAAKKARPAPQVEIPPAKPEPVAAPPPSKIEKAEKPAKVAKQPVQPAPKPAQTTPRAYKVKSGDTLYGICSKVLGNKGAVNQVIALNGLKGPDYSLRPGQVLRLPAAAKPRSH